MPKVIPGGDAATLWHCDENHGAMRLLREVYPRRGLRNDRTSMIGA